MPPQFALLLCIILVIFLLWVESWQKNDVSYALWIPTIWMLYIASKTMGSWFGSEGMDYESGNPIDRIFLGGLICFALFILIKREFDWFKAMKEHVWLMLLLGYMFVSILWSDIPFVSFKRWFRELGAIIMAFFILTEPSSKQALESILRRTTYILIPFSWLLIKYYPLYGVQYDRWSGERMWIGVALQKNSLGRLCFISIFFLIWGLTRRKQRIDIPLDRYKTATDIFVLVLALILFKGPPGVYPATALAVLVIGLATYFALIWVKNHQINLLANIMVVLTLLCIIYGIVTPFLGGATVGAFTSTLGRNETLTGRTEIWAGLIPYIEQRPIWGSGFGSFWTTERRQEQKIDEAHNGYLEVFLELGSVGVILLTIFLLSCCRKATLALKYEFDWASLSICFLLMVVLHNVSESSIHHFSHQLTATMIFLTVLFTNKTRSEGIQN
jgi:exopolysaccharide production protein ExoQ